MAAGIITRSAHPQDLWPGVKAHFGNKYKEHPAEWSQIFEETSSDKYQERVVEATTFGLAPQKPEASSIQYDTDAEGYTSTFTHVVYGLGYVVTEEELEDNQYQEVSMRRAKNLAWSLRTTAEIVHANKLNLGFSEVGGDGVAQFSASHPTLSGLQSNLLTAADLSETAIEDGLKIQMQAKNSRGLRIALRTVRLIIPTDETFNAQRILKSELRQGTANNDINAIKALGAIPETTVNHYLTDPDAWFLQTDVPEGAMSMWRRKASLSKDNDFDTANAKAKSTMRFVAGFGDWRCMYGNPGA